MVDADNVMISATRSVHPSSYLSSFGKGDHLVAEEKAATLELECRETHTES